MKLTDLIIKRFYKRLENDMLYRDDYKEIFSLICGETMRLADTCCLDDSELSILHSEMKCAAIEKMKDVLDPFEALDALDDCGAEFPDDHDFEYEQAERLSRSIVKWLYRWIEEDTDPDEQSNIDDTLKSACEKTAKLIDRCDLPAGSSSDVYDEMKCAVLERASLYYEPFDLIEMIVAYEEAC